LKLLNIKLTGGANTPDRSFLSGFKSIQKLSGHPSLVACLFIPVFNLNTSLQEISVKDIQCSNLTSASYYPIQVFLDVCQQLQVVSADALLIYS
jgi:hypothetical protein